MPHRVGRGLSFLTSINSNAYSTKTEEAPLAEEKLHRRLAAILSADVVGYSRLMGMDEAGTLEALRAHRSELIDPAIAEHSGRIVKQMGDGLLVEFTSAINALECAVALQQGMALRNAKVPDDRLIAFRIGINLGEVIIESDDIYGDGVNVAARLQGVAGPGGIYISGSVFEQVDGKVDLSFDDMGNQHLKNITKPVRVHRVNLANILSAAERSPFFARSSRKQESISGGCLCGAIRYEITGPSIDVGFCHCRMCQRFTGAPLHVFASFPTESVRFTQGEPKYYKSSPVAARGFCADCGSSLTWKPLFGDWSDWLAIICGTLDHPEDIAPTWHTGVESQMPWLHVHDNLPRVRSKDQPDLVKAWASFGLPVPEPNLW
jgi:adenylate cyclase